jgi:ubiquinone/menaquinone biosynthesis C-methylase UbiE
MQASDDHKARVAAIYDSASERYDAPALSFWDRFGQRTIERLSLEPRMRVLDACCGSGASALPAARSVGPDGQVLAIDLSEKLLSRGRERAARLGLRNVQFQRGDLERLGPPERSFDVAVCVFGIFFLPDMAAGVRALRRQVRPGGRLAITTWGDGVFDPADRIFWDAVARVRPDLHKTFNPWERVGDPIKLRALLEEGGIDRSEITLEEGFHPLAAPEAFWELVLGSGYRGAVDPMSEAERATVRSEVLRALRERKVTAINASVLYAMATLPSGLPADRADSTP